MGIRAYGITLRQLIVVAYGLQSDQLEGADAWVSTRYWSFSATAASAATPGNVRLMLRSTLTSRFGLRLTEQNLSTPVYALRVAPGGLRVPKLDPGRPPSYKGYPPPGECAFTVLRRFSALASIFNYPRPHLGRPVVDQTGLTGNYDIGLFLPCDKGGGLQMDAASVGRAVRRQLGVELKPEVISRKTVTIISAHLPTPN